MSQSDRSGLSAIRGRQQTSAPELVEIRVTAERSMLVPTWRPVAAQNPGPPSTPPPKPLAPAGGLPSTQPLQPPCGSPAFDAGPPPLAVRPRLKPLVVLIEAVPCGADDLALAAAEVLEGSGLRPGLVSLDRQNRLGARLGAPAASPTWCWNQAAPELLVSTGAKLLVPGPAHEAELTQEGVQQVLQQVRAATDAALVDLGCRWEPRLFRPILFQASQIWLLTRCGMWSGAEMRLEQAELSGWTDMRRVSVVIIGAALPPPGVLGATIGGVLPEPGGQAAREFVARELRGM